MYLYNLTLQQPTCISQCISGAFSGQKVPEILIVKGNSLIEILRPDPESGKLVVILQQRAFCKIRSIVPFRLAGSSKDYIIVGSDSGRIVIFEYISDQNVLEKLHQETFGKSGTRRIVPGEYLATDPKGRAVMISAIEKSKLVYVLNKDSNARITISSPLEANKSKIITVHTVGVDVGYENPVFAALEIDYAECDEEQNEEHKDINEKLEKTLTFYELDLGLNHVVRKWNTAVDSSANYLISVPGPSGLVAPSSSADGPGGVLVCSEDYITWINQGMPQISIRIPRANSKDLSQERSVFIVSAAMHKSKSMLFFLLQNEDGDIFKLTMDHSSGIVTQLTLRYFDTVDPAHSFTLTKNGFLFFASESGGNKLYHVEKLGDDEVSFSSSINSLGPKSDFVFNRHEQVVNIGLVDELINFSPLSDAKICNYMNEDIPYFLTATGKSPYSACLSVLKYGLDVIEVASSTLPASTSGIWCLKGSLSDTYHEFIVISFMNNSTIVLKIDEEAVQEITQTINFISTAKTLTVFMLFNDCYIQVVSSMMRQIRSDKSYFDWRVSPSSSTITSCSGNQRQLVLVLDYSEFVYFEVNELGSLQEKGERRKVPLTITAVAIGELAEGSQKSSFLAVGCSDQTVRLISLEEDSWLEMYSVQAFQSLPTSLNLSFMNGVNEVFLFLHVGLSDGMYSRIQVDSHSGAFVNVSSRSIGSSEVIVDSAMVDEKRGGVSLSTVGRCSLVYWGNDVVSISPLLSHYSLRNICSFSSENCPYGFVCSSDNLLKIIYCRKYDSSFNKSATLTLKYTPKRIIQSDFSPLLAIIESDHRSAIVEDQRNDPALSIACPPHSNADSVGKNGGQEAIDEDAMQISEDEDEYEDKDKDEQSDMNFGYLRENDDFELLQANQRIEESQPIIRRCKQGKWASRITIFDPYIFQVKQEIRITDDFVPVSGSFVRFSSYPNQQFLAIGAVKNFVPNPKSFSSCAVFVFRQSLESNLYELMHVTDTEDIPISICPFQGMLLVGVGNVLRMYDLGKKQLLRKCECKQIPNAIATIHSKGLRVIVGDIQQGALFLQYKILENQFVVFADDFTPRWLSSPLCLVDYDTVAGGDKFGNFFVNRLPDYVVEIIERDPTCCRLSEKPYLLGASHKLNQLVDYHIGEIVTSINKATIAVKGKEVLIYTTIMGSIGIFAPFETKRDFDFFQLLEASMRTEYGNSFGREHLSYRSSYIPVNNVIDGDLCEMFHRLPLVKRTSIAASLGKSIVDISAKLEHFRNYYGY